MPAASHDRRPAKQRRSARSATGGELALIERIRLASLAAGAGIPGSRVRLGIGDDCAILRPPAGHELLVTTDFSLEGRHFRRDTHPPAAIGHRTLARGLSDLAAMGADPMAAFLSLAMPRSLARNGRFFDGFLQGMLALAAAHDVPLAGGDTSESPSEHLLADILLLGSAASGRAMRRSGARAGDAIYVTGALGGAAAELTEVLRHPQRFRQTRNDAASLAGEHPHLYPQPRLAVGRALLRRRLATACIDVSDGLSTDLNHLCEASGVGAELEVDWLPAHPLTAQMEEAAQIAAVLHGGEDYELLFTARPRTKMPRSIAGVPVTRIGRIVAASNDEAASRMTLIAGGERFGLEPRGWEHLR